MFFRRMFGRKDDIGEIDDDEHNDLDETDENDNKRNWSDFELQRNRRHTNRNGYRKAGGPSTAPAGAIGGQRSHSAAGLKHRNIVTSGAVGGTPSLQLTPLWEHILRTRTIPESICPNQMFAEFNERLRDPEWQVRQHALRVFVDVLVVMRAQADAYMEVLIPQLVENLGHPAPTVRKGALDCLRVYLTETAMPETVMLQVLDIGLNQKITNEPFGGRLTCGVMLSLPALVQSTLHTTKRHFILRATIDMLVQKMGQVTHQEITLKVLAKIRELIGEREFSEFMSHGAYREFELLCNVYGVGQPGSEPATKAKVTENGHGNVTWRYVAAEKPTLNCWRSSDEEQMLDIATPPLGKVIMETEIKINDDTLTMRILEAKDDETNDETEVSPRKSQDNEYPNSIEDDVVCGRLASARSEREITGVIQMLSDSEVEDNNNTAAVGGSQSSRPEYFTVITPSTPSRTPKRVTFGGELVKMRTPDSDATTSNSNSNGDANNAAGSDTTTKLADNVDDNKFKQEEPAFIAHISPPTTDLESPTSPTPTPMCKTTELSLEIPSDNTKPLPRPRTAQSPKSVAYNESTATTAISASPAFSLPSTTASNSPSSPLKRRDSTTSLSPRSPFRRLSVSPVDGIVSPKTVHKEIEVLHNLQRDPSPVRRGSVKSLTDLEAETTVEVAPKKVESFQQMKARETPPPPASWEDLNIVDYDTLEDLRSGNWRFRLQGINQLEESLRSTENLALVQPCLASLLRTLLSSERHHDVAEAKHRLLTNLISRLPLDNLEERTVQIMTGLCRQGGAGANRVCKALMQRLPPAVIVLKLISREFLHAKSSRFREHALQMVMFALMTFPSTCFDTNTCITNATFAALNRKRRVRQAALEVLAILGQVTTARAVMDVVESVAEESQREDGAILVAAVKARLSRKQLPLVTGEGVVQYTLRLPSAAIPHTQQCGIDVANGQFGPDIEWITAGVGSVSPTSMRRRAHKARCTSQQSFCCLPAQRSMGSVVGFPEGSGFHQLAREKNLICTPNDLFDKDLERNQRLSHAMGDDSQTYKLQHVLGNHFALMSRKPNVAVDYHNYKNRRLVDKSCSDSSMEGRSSDSTYTSSDGITTAASNAVAASECNDMGCGGGISGRFTRQPVNSRFPTMDSYSTCARVHKPPAYQAGMGAYAQLQQQQYNMSSTYPKVNYTLPPNQRRRSHQSQQQQQLQYNYNNNNNYQHYQQHHHHQQQQQHHHQHQHQTQKGNPLAQESFKQIETCNRQQKDKAQNVSDDVDADDLDGTYTICQGVVETTNENVSGNATKIQQQSSNQRRFVNVDKFVPESNNRTPSTTTAAAADDNTKEMPSPFENRSESKEATPVSAKSTTYSQKSTASARSEKARNERNQQLDTTPNRTHNEIIQNSTKSLNSISTQDRLEIEHVANGEDGEVNSFAADEEPNSQIKLNNESELKRSASILSLQSKSESIKTQLDDTPPNVSRAQSLKSLAIEEDIEENNDSFVIVEEATEQQLSKQNSRLAGAGDQNSDESLHDSRDEFDGGADVGSLNNSSKPHTAGSCPRSPTIAELKILSRRNSMIKSMESLYERTPSAAAKIAAATAASKQDSTETTTESSTQSSPHQIAAVAAAAAATSIPMKPQHTPLKQKAKTSYFLRNHRRVSPVKQSIKMQQAELFPATLQRFEKPRDALQKTFDQLDSANWEVIMQGLKSMVRLMRYHVDYLETQMHMVCIQLTRSVRNLRSQVARAACQAATEIFGLKSKMLEQECDDLVCALLHRTADTNRFLRADATRALESMCDSLAPSKVLNILTNKGALHQHALVRTTTSKLLNRLAVRLGNEKLYAMPRENRDKFFVTGANLLLEGSLETRSYAKTLFRLLSDHPSYNRLVQEVIPQRTYRNIEKTLKSIQ